MNHSCPVCNKGLLVQKETFISVDHADQKLTVRRFADVCTLCGTDMVSPVQIRLNSRAIQRAKNLADGLLIGSEIRAFRLKNCLEQSEASKLFGGGPTAFAKYEVDEIAHNISMDRLLRLCMDQPSLIISLASKYGIDLRPETLSSIKSNHEAQKVNFDVRINTIMNQRSEGADLHAYSVSISGIPATAVALGRSRSNATASVCTRINGSFNKISDVFSNRLAA